MRKLTSLVVVIAVVQLILGFLYLLAPAWLLAQMGHSAIAPDLAYPLAMLAARFLVYGGLMLWVARQPQAHRLLLLGMLWIQVIDLLAGVRFTLDGTVSLALSGFPMFNAAVFALLLWRWTAPPQFIAKAA